jgi:hypothetical protein
MKVKSFQSCHTPHVIARARFESAPISTTQTGCSSIIEYVRAYTSEGAAHTKQSSLILTQ